MLIVNELLAQVWVVHMHYRYLRVYWTLQEISVPMILSFCCFFYVGTIPVYFYNQFDWIKSFEHLLTFFSDWFLARSQDRLTTLNLCSLCCLSKDPQFKVESGSPSYSIICHMLILVLQKIPCYGIVKIHTVLKYNFSIISIVYQWNI